jgi:hypothetical protein
VARRLDLGGRVPAGGGGRGLTDAPDLAAWRRAELSMADANRRLAATVPGSSGASRAYTILAAEHERRAALLARMIAEGKP